MADLKLQGRIAAVTGGGRGLGRALVRGLAAEGADVAFSYRESRGGAEEEAGRLRAQGCRAFIAPADARVRGDLPRFVDAAAAALGGLDLLVNNVGVFRRVTLEAMSDSDLDEAFDVNVKAAVMASRAALIMATRVLALALAPDIRVNAVAPGILDPPGGGPGLREKVPLQRFGTHAEAVQAVLYLAADASYTTGEVLTLDGGRCLE
jgi:NAD(P)-dependent dehydrogenase (short-subunit alcohol dehydrogenase family)